MPKKSKATNADLVKRLREAHDQLRAQSTRAARAADTLGRLIRQVEAQVAPANGQAAPARRPRAIAARNRTGAAPARPAS